MVQTKEERKAYIKTYHIKHKEQITIYGKEWYQKNKVRKSATSKANYEANKEKINSSNSAWKKTPNGKKSSRITAWKRRGTIGDLSTFYDERYFPATKCEVCEKEFKSTSDKCMDHCHDTGEIRWVLCKSCNCRDYWKKVIARKEEDILP